MDTPKQYPVYRKWQNGQEFHKVISETETLSVLKTKFGYRIQFSTNKLIQQDITDNEVAMPSTRDEFEKAYGEAHWAFTQANKLQ